jgi:hypothetical protein
MHCANNMRQWALAAHNYHDAHQSMPPARNYCHTSQDRFSATYLLLPFMEQQNTFDRMRETTTNTWPDTTDINATEVVTKPISSLRCPSDSWRNQPSITGSKRNRHGAVGNIVVCYGDGANRLHYDDTGNEGDISTRGMFYWTVGKTMSITDGTSNTVLVSESCVAHSNGSHTIKGGIAWLPAIDLGVAWVWSPSVCMAIGRNGQDFVGNALGQWRCARYYDGMVLYTGFNTVLPPNSPSCVKNDTEATSGFYTANSNHFGGVNTARVDGSVNFIGDAVDTGGIPDGVQGRLLTGQSLYGVWGALGTPDSGEIINAP